MTWAGKLLLFEMLVCLGTLGPVLLGLANGVLVLRIGLVV